MVGITDNFKQAYNTKFSKASVILSRLKRLAPSKTFSPVDVIEWSSECVVEELKMAPAWYTYKKVALTVTNGKALLPCNLYRLLDVYDRMSKRVKYDDSSGSYLVFEGYSDTYIYINYYGLPIDSDGMILIPKGSEKACTYYCLKMVYQDDYMTNKINGQQWQMIDEEYNQGQRQAWSNIKGLSRNEEEELQQMNYNFVWDPSRVPIFNMD
jgi:hypothetical protein